MQAFATAGLAGLILVLSLVPAQSRQPQPAREKIERLAVRLVTSSEPFAGTDCDVWFDVGPRAWKLSGDFPAGSDRTVEVELTPATPALYVEDIIQVRLEKKGVFGWTNAPDTLLDPKLPGGETPEQVVAAWRRKVEAAKYALEQAQALVDVQKKIIDAQAGAIAAANDAMNRANGEVSRLTGLVNGLQNQLVDVQRQLAQAPRHVVREIRKLNPVLKLAIFGPQIIMVPVIEKITEPNGLWDQLTNRVADLAKQKNNFEADVARFALEKEKQLRTKATAEAAKAAAEAAKVAADLQVTVARKALDAADQGLARAQELAKGLDLKLLSLPRPGEWKPEGLTVLVNGREFGTYTINQRLKQGHPAWVHPVKTLSAEERFVHGLRVDLNRPGGRFAQMVEQEAARLTTLFKNLGVSGWLDDVPVKKARVTGTLRNPPSAGRDGFVSLDLELERVEANGKTFVLDGRHEVRHARFLRVEYKHRAAGRADDERYRSWKVGDRFEIGGRVRWDTDRGGFYEIHPEDQADVKALSR